MARRGDGYGSREIAFALQRSIRAVYIKLEKKQWHEGRRDRPVCPRSLPGQAPGRDRGAKMRKPRPKVKFVKLDQLAKIQPKYSGAVGAYITETDTIYVDVGLPKVTHGSRTAALRHEVGHRIIALAGIKCASEDQEERFCLWWELFTTPKRFISWTERLAREDALGGLSWTNVADRPAIARVICRKLGRGFPARKLMAALKEQGHLESHG